MTFYHVEYFRDLFHQYPISKKYPESKHKFYVVSGHETFDTFKSQKNKFTTESDSSLLLKIIGLDKDNIIELQENPYRFLIFDNSFEGYPEQTYNIYKLLTNLGKDYNLPNNKIFYFSSNIKELENYNFWKNKKEDIEYDINILVFNAHESRNYSKFKKIDLDTTVKEIKRLSNNKLDNFLCFNRVKRQMRMITCFNIFNSNFYKNTKLSSDFYSPNEVIQAVFDAGGPILKKRDVQAYSEHSYHELDRCDFTTQWANLPVPTDLFKRTVISIVNETMQNFDYYTNRYNLFYSEKTFKVMELNHPLIITGPVGINKGLNEIGYKDYSCYFNLDFDDIENHWERNCKMISLLEDLNDKLQSMSKKNKINWILEGIETLHYNKLARMEFKFTNLSVDKAIEKFYNLIS